MARTGVYPVFENKFRIGTEGRSSGQEAMKTVSNLETFEVTVDGNIEEWKPLEQEGWVRRMVTGKSITIKLGGKRDLGDAGNDYVAANAWATGAGCDTRFEWVFPDGAKLAFDCVLNVTNAGGGDATDVGPLEFEVHSDGKPVYTPAV